MFIAKISDNALDFLQGAEGLDSPGNQTSLWTIAPINPEPGGPVTMESSNPQYGSTYSRSCAWVLYPAIFEVDVSDISHGGSMCAGLWQC
jgi:hypothetical protein